MKVALLVALAGAASVAQADLYTSADITGDSSHISAASMQNVAPANRTTDGYFLGHAIGGAGGFALISPNVDSIFNGASEVLGADGTTGGTITSSDATLVGDVFALGNTVIQVQLDTTAADMFISGFTVGGLPADSAGMFMGANAGGNPLDFTNPAFMNQALLYTIDASGATTNVFDVTGIMGTLGDGSWDGSAGVSISGLMDAGTVAAGFQFDLNIVPAPGSAALFGFAGLVATRRRR